MTDNPSGSTGQNVTAPANAPAGSDSNVIANIVRKHGGHPTAVAAKLIEAGFTRRAQHDGERVAGTYAHMCRMDHVEIGHNDSTSEQCPLCRAIDERCNLMDEMSDVYPDLDRVGFVVGLKALVAERDALAARVKAADEALRDHSLVLCEKHAIGYSPKHGCAACRADAAIARAEAAEEQVAMRDMALDHLQGRYDAAGAKLATAIGCLDTEQETLRRVDAAESRAAALAEALNHIGHGEINATSADDALRQVVDYARAALAGNGTGERT